MADHPAPFDGTAADDALLDRYQHAAFGYFLEGANPENGLIADTTGPGAPASIAVAGFALSCYPVGVERGWMRRADAIARTLVLLRFFLDGSQAGGEAASGHRGFYYHFLDMSSGRRVWNSELSPIDTALLLAGVLTARSYFDGDAHDEMELRACADALCHRVDWLWALGPGPTLPLGWKPRSGFSRRRWEGYSEALLLYIIAMGAPQHPLPADAFPAWTSTFRWGNVDGFEQLHAGPLFIHQFPHAWIDLRGVRDDFMRNRNSDYFENSRRAVRVQRDYARLNPLGFAGYGENAWGFTANEGPGDTTLTIGGRRRRFWGYTARGVPFGPDDGTLNPAAVLASMPFAPGSALSTLRHFEATYPEAFRNSLLPGGFNPTFPGEGAAGWVCGKRFGLDQGIVVMMIENHRSGLIWLLTRRSAWFERGMRRSGFSGGWLR